MLDSAYTLRYSLTAIDHLKPHDPEAAGESCVGNDDLCHVLRANVGDSLHYIGFASLAGTAWLNVGYRTSIYRTAQGRFEADGQ